MSAAQFGVIFALLAIICYNTMPLRRLEETLRSSPSGVAGGVHERSVYAPVSQDEAFQKVQKFAFSDGRMGSAIDEQRKSLVVDGKWSISVTPYGAESMVSIGTVPGANSNADDTERLVQGVTEAIAAT